MARARWAQGLRRGSTKSTTYSTLATKKEGRIQIIKDRVYEVANPQTVNQMITRVVFATVTQAAEFMRQLVGICIEGISNRKDAKNEWVSINVKKLRDIAQTKYYHQDFDHPDGMYAPKGNQQLIPNSYIMSKGSLQLPEVLRPKIYDDDDTVEAGSFNGYRWMKPISETAQIAIPNGTYTGLDFWRLIWGMQPGDQISCPQIYLSDMAQKMYVSDVIVDCTRYYEFYCPRVVLNKSAATITVDNNTTVGQIINAMRAAVNTAASWPYLVSQMTLLEISGSGASRKAYIDMAYDDIYQISDDPRRVVGLACILSRRDYNGKWRYSTSEMSCAYKVQGTGDVPDDWYFGFYINNAVETYMSQSQQTADGNFLQSGGSSDMLPQDFT